MMNDTDCQLPTCINPPIRATLDDARFKCRMDDDGNIDITIAHAGNGGWKRVSAPRATFDTFEGFGAENVITVTYMTMQSGDWNVVGVQSQIDNPLVVVTRQGRGDCDGPVDDVMMAAITEVLGQLANCEFQVTNTRRH